MPYRLTTNGFGAPYIQTLAFTNEGAPLDRNDVIYLGSQQVINTLKAVRNHFAVGEKFNWALGEKVLGEEIKKLQALQDFCKAQEEDRLTDDYLKFIEEGVDGAPDA